MKAKDIRNRALEEARQVAISHSNYGTTSGNLRAFKIANAINALKAQEDD